jgi:antitoxin component YwqK of YwqJK toxin-antitoxin module
MYENGKKAGVWKSFDNNGILEEETTYDNGKKISVKTY